MGEGNGDEERVIRVRGLPWSATKDDIVKFFDGIGIMNGLDGIHIILSRGRPIGEAYIELVDQEDIPNAMEKNNQYMGIRYIEVFEAKRSEMEMVIKEENADGCCVKLRGLPFGCSKEEIMLFFSDGIGIMNGLDGIHIILSRGRPTGEAYIELVDKEDIPKAMQKHKQYMGKRYIEVFEAKRSEMEWVIKRANAGPDHEDDCCVKLRGIPFDCSKEEIMQFFSGLEIVPNGIALPTNYQGRSTGEAFVQFVNKETAQKAMEKHKEKIAHRYIEISESNLNVIGSVMRFNMRGSGSRGGFRRPSPFGSRDRFGDPYRYNMSTGRAFSTLSGSFNQGYNDYDDSPTWGNNFNDNCGGGGGMGMKGNFGFRGGSGGPGNAGSVTGHCVHMRGLPFRAAEFFRPLNPVNITIQMDSSNRPSGEADVECANPDFRMSKLSCCSFTQSQGAFFPVKLWRGAASLENVEIKGLKKATVPTNPRTSLRRFSRGNPLIQATLCGLGLIWSLETMWPRYFISLRANLPKLNLGLNTSTR